MNIYEVITKRIIEQLEKGVVAWRCPWKTGVAQNLLTRKPYRGINATLLGSLPFPNPYFLTFKQAKRLGHNVKVGERGTPIVFWNFIEDDDSQAKRKIPFLRYYTVFNASQCEGIEIPPISQREFNPIEECERIVSGMPNPPKMIEGAYAAYAPSTDTTKMPARERFDSEESYYSTLFHELSHSTGHTSRLNRKGITEDVAFGSETYSKEELIAELSASFICGGAGISAATIAPSASYISGWLKVLRSDNRMVVQAAGQAQKATDYILRNPTGDDNE